MWLSIIFCFFHTSGRNLSKNCQYRCLVALIKFKGFFDLILHVIFQVSRPRTRTISFQTIDPDDFTNVDLQSFPESNSDDCVSFPSNGDENIEMKR